MLALTEGLEDHLEDPLVCVDILAILNVVQAIADTVGIVDVRQQGRGQLVIGHIRFLAFDLLAALWSCPLCINHYETLRFLPSFVQRIIFIVPLDSIERMSANGYRSCNYYSQNITLMSIFDCIPGFPLIRRCRQQLLWLTYLPSIHCGSGSKPCCIPYKRNG